MFGSYRYLTERVDKYLSSLYWTDINIHSALYSDKTSVNEINVYEPKNLTRPLIEEILQISKNDDKDNKFVRTSLGSSFSPSWSTKWFHIEFIVPICLAGKRLALEWDSNSEAMLYSADGIHLQSFTGGGGNDRRDYYIFPTKYAIGSRIEIFVEMACNGMFGNGGGGMILPPDSNRMFTLQTCAFVAYNQDAHDLFWDITVLNDLSKTLPESSSALGGVALEVANNIINTVNLKDKDSILRARSMANTVLNQIPVSFALSSDEVVRNQYHPSIPIHNRRLLTSKTKCEVNVLGHCHIDTAWLWPYAETRRKVARSWSTQLQLLRRYPNWKFVASQSVHWEWLKEDHPKLFNEIITATNSVRSPVIASTITFQETNGDLLKCEDITNGNHVDYFNENLECYSTSSRFIPVGGSYVEFDGNIPSGESMIRQFLYGKAFFHKHVLSGGNHSRNKMEDIRVFWLPDTFGYSGQLPQICRNFGIPYFLSQKLSWNLFNK